jgi:outer membrane protein assembly factor BamB
MEVPDQGTHNGKLYAVDARTGKLAWKFQTEASKKDPLKVLNQDGSLNQQTFAPLFGDSQDMYMDVSRFISVGAILSSPAVDRGVVYVVQWMETYTRCNEAGF